MTLHDRDPFHHPGMSEGETLVPNDPLNRQYLLAKGIGLERKQEIVPHIDVPQTYRPLSGLRQNQRGQNVMIASAFAFSGDFPTKTIVQAKSPGDDAEMVVVTLGAITFTEDVDPLTTGLDVRLLGTLTWGVGGAQFSTQFDWINGTLLALPVNFLRVDVTAPDNSLAVPPPPPFIISASIAYGTIGAHRNRARRSIQVGALAPGATSAPIPIPPFAVSMTLSTSNGSAVAPGPIVPMNIHQFDEPVLGVVRADYTYANASNTGWNGDDAFPIATGARFVQIRNDSAFASLFTNAIFELAL